MTGKAELPSVTRQRQTFMFEYVRTRGYKGEAVSTEPGTGPGPESPAASKLPSSDSEIREAMNKMARKLKKAENENYALVNLLSQKRNRMNAWAQTNLDGHDQTSDGSEALPVPVNFDPKQEFAKFAENHPKYLAHQANKKIAEEKINEVKALSNQAIELKREMEDLFQSIERIRAENGGRVDCPEIQEIREVIIQKSAEREKVGHQIADLRSDIDRLKAMIKAFKTIDLGMIKRDFQKYLTDVSPKLQQRQQAVVQPPPTVAEPEIERPKSSTRSSTTSASGTRKSTKTRDVNDIIRNFEETAAAARALMAKDKSTVST